MHRSSRSTAERPSPPIEPDPGRAELTDDQDAPPPLEQGSEIKPGYRVISLLRRGVDLDVYDLWSDERGCRCVGKVVRPDRIDGRAPERLRRESRLLLRLSHPHLVRAYALVLGDAPMLVLETLPGETLRFLLERRKRLTIRETAHLGLHLCSALEYLHRQDVLHLDLKPSNVISSCGIGKLLDLSVARAPGRCRGGTGTPGYMAPEQLAGGVLSPATDAWGLGAVLFEAVTGREACPVPETVFDPASPFAREPSPPIRSLRRVPAGVGSIIDACLLDDPAQRPVIAEVAEALLRVVLPQP
jgi:serine/threonine protein kinase